MSVDQLFQTNGVVKIENFFSSGELSNLKNEYFEIYNNRDTSEIYKDEPLVVLWTHVVGANKKTCRLSELPSFKSCIEERLVPYLAGFLQRNYGHISNKRLQLLETIVFNKPPQRSNNLNWHQDVAYFPLKPNNQVAVWFPLEDVTSDIGPMVYAHKSHKSGIRGSTNLHTREPFDGETRKLIPQDPSEEGFDVVEYPMRNVDLLIHDGYTWHYSKPNKSKDKQRMGVSVRFIIEDVVFDPRPGQGAAFTRQIDVKAGEQIVSPCFPVYWKENSATCIEMQAA